MKGKWFLEADFEFSRAQKLGWQKVGFNTNGVDLAREE